MLLTLLSFLPFLIAQATAAPEVAANGDLMLKVLIPTGGVSSVLYAIWYYTFKQNKKDYAAALQQNQSQFDFALKQNQQQFDFALKQNQQQFEKSLVFIMQQYKDNTDQTLKTIDKLFEFIQSDIEYKEVLTGVLTRMEQKLERTQ